MARTSGKLFSINPTRAIVMGYGTVIFAGTLLLSLPAASAVRGGTSFLDTLFTATSAVCVTGLVVVDTYSHWTLFGRTVILCLIQIGGLGFMTVATLFSFVLRRRISLKERLLIVESLNQYNIQGIVLLTRRILLGTLIFEGVGALLLSLRFVPEFGVFRGVYSGIFHSVSAFCNAGFDLMGQKEAFSSFTSYTSDPLVSVTLMLLIVSGGLGFAVWNDILKNKSYKKLHIHSKLVVSVTVFLLVSGFIVFFAAEYGNPDTLGALSRGARPLAAMFQSVTTRTAGFNTISQADMGNASVITTLAFMFVGGSPGSAAGGIKTATLGVIVFAVAAFIRGKSDTEIFKRRINKDLVIKAFVIAVTGIMLVSVVTVIISASNDVTLKQAVFEAISAFGTVGLSTGITPGLSTVSKVTVIVTMLLGRVGILTMAIAVATGNGPKPLYRYREDRVMVG